MTVQHATVNFYILPDSDINNRHFFVFRLVEKAFEQQLSTAILTTDADQANAIDKLLWTARPERFIPHEIINQGQQGKFPSIVITDNITTLQDVGFSPQVVIDLSHDATPLNYPKIMLVVNQHAEILANARMKYQSYVNQGIKPTVHKISEQQLL